MNLAITISAISVIAGWTHIILLEKYLKYRIKMDKFSIGIMITVVLSVIYIIICLIKDSIKLHK